MLVVLLLELALLAVVVVLVQLELVEIIVLAVMVVMELQTFLLGVAQLQREKMFLALITTQAVALVVEQVQTELAVLAVVVL
jgi:hypothetical protein